MTQRFDNQSSVLIVLRIESILISSRANDDIIYLQISFW